MPEEYKTESLERRLHILWMIWAAVLITLFIYVFICHLVAAASWRGANPEIPLDLLRTILYCASIIVLLLARYLRRRILSARQGGFRKTPPTPASALNQAQFVSQYPSAIIVSCALSESVGIFGLVLFLLGDSFQILYLFIFVSVIALIYFRPKREEIERLAKGSLTGGAMYE